MSLRVFSKSLLISASFFSVVSVTEAKNITTKPPLKISANEILINPKKKQIVAMGQVNLLQETDSGQRTVECDRVIFDQTTGVIKASGLNGSPIKLTQANSDIFYAKELELASNMSAGEMHEIVIKRVNHSTLTSQRLKRADANGTVLYQADYTACQFCETQKPLWKLCSAEVEHDENTQTMTYKNVVLRIKDVPVLYSPYFSHPDPTVKRKSGVLAPTFARNTDLGYVVSVPVYYVISQSQDLTITPSFASKELGIIHGEYRNRLHNGNFELSGSYTRSQHVNLYKPYVSTTGKVETPGRDRWNFKIDTNKDINDQNRFLMSLNKASDTTYLSRYALVRQTPFVNHNTNLRSNIAWQFYDKNTYADVESLYFQTDAQETTPSVLPKITLSHQAPAPHVGGVWGFDTNFLALLRDKEVIGRAGTRMFRVSQRLHYRREDVISNGHIISFRLDGRIDYYVMKKYYDTHAQFENPKTRKNKTHLRFFPQSSLMWKWPIYRDFETSRLIITPKMMIASSPLTINNRHIPNEDSLTNEVDDLSMFTPNRFNGLDRVDAGSRIVVGVDSHMILPAARKIGLFIGKTYRLDKQMVFNKGQGEDGKSSDLVGRLNIRFSDMVQTRQRAAYSANLNAFRYLENGLLIGPKQFKMSLGHVQLNSYASPSGNAVSQANLHISSQFSTHWNGYVGQIRNLKKRGGGAILGTFLGMRYDDECFTMDVGIYKSSQYDRDIKPETSFLVRFNFKTLSALTVSSAPEYPTSPLTAGLS